MATELKDVKYQVAVANRVLAELGLASGVLAALGHASMRVPSQPDTFVVKGRGYEMDALARMRPEDMVICDLEGYKVGGPPHATQCFEVKMHSCIYKTHPEVQSIVHVHPRYTVLMSVLQKRLLPMCNEGLYLVRDPLPVYDDPMVILTEEQGMETANLLGDSKAILFKGHGAATVGKSLQESVIFMLQLEEQAKMNWYAYCAAGPDHQGIPFDQADEVIEWLAKMPINELPHFTQEVRAAGVQTGGVWAYYADLVSKDLRGPWWRRMLGG